MSHGLDTNGNDRTPHEVIIISPQAISLVKKEKSKSEILRDLIGGFLANAKTEVGIITFVASAFGISITSPIPIGFALLALPSGVSFYYFYVKPSLDNTKTVALSTVNRLPPEEVKKHGKIRPGVLAFLYSSPINWSLVQASSVALATSGHQTLDETIFKWVLAAATFSGVLLTSMPSSVTFLNELGWLKGGEPNEKALLKAKDVADVSTYSSAQKARNRGLAYLGAGIAILNGVGLGLTIVNLCYPIEQMNMKARLATAIGSFVYAHLACPTPIGLNYDGFNHWGNQISTPEAEGGAGSLGNFLKKDKNYIYLLYALIFQSIPSNLAGAFAASFTLQWLFTMFGYNTFKTLSQMLNQKEVPEDALTLFLLLTQMALFIAAVFVNVINKGPSTRIAAHAMWKGICDLGSKIKALLIHLSLWTAEASHSGEIAPLLPPDTTVNIAVRSVNSEDPNELWDELPRKRIENNHSGLLNHPASPDKHSLRRSQTTVPISASNAVPPFSGQHPRSPASSKSPRLLLQPSLSPFRSHSTPPLRRTEKNYYAYHPPG